MRPYLIVAIACLAGLLIGSPALRAGSVATATSEGQATSPPGSESRATSTPDSERRADAREAAEQGGIASLAGPDVMLGDIQTLGTYGPTGSIYAYSIGSHTCNVGSSSLLWTNSGTPGLAMNMYRLHDGRLVQIGQSWVKHACCAAQSTSVLCGTSCMSGSGLGPGCLDVYTQGWNAGQGWLGPRSGINAYSGSFSPLSGSFSGPIARRLQVNTANMGSTLYPGALYFVEGVYVGSDDAANSNWYNNATYKRMTLSASYQATLTGSVASTFPAVYAWYHHGNGVGAVDPTVNIQNVDVPGEGRFVSATKVRDLGNGTWRYDYAVFNLNSHRSGGSFSVPLPTGVNVTNVGFNDVDYHSGEPYSNADWISSVTANSVTWSSPQTFAQNQNTNALRWGTMYNFWFDADREPTSAQVTLGLFRPGTPESVSFGSQGPAPALCPADLAPPAPNGDGTVNVDDLLVLLGAWGPCAACAADLNGDGAVDVDDLLALLAAWGPC